MSWEEAPPDRRHQDISFSLFMRAILLSGSQVITPGVEGISWASPGKQESNVEWLRESYGLKVRALSLAIQLT